MGHTQRLCALSLSPLETRANGSSATTAARSAGQVNKAMYRFKLFRKLVGGKFECWWIDQPVYGEHWFPVREWSEIRGTRPAFARGTPVCEEYPDTWLHRRALQKRHPVIDSGIRRAARSLAESRAHCVRPCERCGYVLCFCPPLKKRRQRASSKASDLMIAPLALPLALPPACSAPPLPTVEQLACRALLLLMEARK